MSDIKVVISYNLFAMFRI